MRNQQTLSVAIVGAGIGGLAVAAALLVYDRLDENCAAPRDGEAADAAPTIATESVCWFR